jgi:PhzF family phenazine biosynthesis protein
MPSVSVSILNAFVDAGAGGNPAGVVLDADALTRDQKQDIAARVGVPETAFVSRSTAAPFKLEFFTRTRQIPHCGHATVATFTLLDRLGMIAEPLTSKETIDGVRNVSVRDGMVFLQQLPPRVVATVPIAQLLGPLALSESDFAPRSVPVAITTGNPFLLVPLRDEAAVLKVQPDFAAVAALTESLSAIGMYVFSRQVREEGRDAGARMFAPGFGIDEEAATGTAAGPLGCWLHGVAGLRQDAFTIEQGRLMNPPSPSIMHVEVIEAGGRINGVRVGGRAVLQGTREVSFE